MTDERSSNAERRRWSALDAMLWLQGAIAVSLFVFALVASVAGAAFVHSLTTFAVLQLLIAAPGMYATIYQSSRFIAIYGVLQLFTGFCELIWAVDLLLVAENAKMKGMRGYGLLAATTFQFVAALIAISVNPLSLLRNAKNKHKHIVLVRTPVNLQSPSVSSPSRLPTSTQTPPDDDGVSKSSLRCPQCVVPFNSQSTQRDIMSAQASPSPSDSWSTVVSNSVPASSFKLNSESQVSMCDAVGTANSKSVAQLETAISPEERATRSPREQTAQSPTDQTACSPVEKTARSPIERTALECRSSAAGLDALVLLTSSSDSETGTSFQSATTATNALQNPSTDCSAQPASTYCITINSYNLGASTSTELPGHIASTVDSDCCSPVLSAGGSAQNMEKTKI